MSGSRAALKSVKAFGSTIQRRDISSVKFRPPHTYKKDKDMRKAMVGNVFAYAKEVGLDDLGAEWAEVSGSHHAPQDPNDPDQFERLTVKFFDKDSKAMTFVDPYGVEHRRLHIATDNQYWHQAGHWSKA
ncbi:uncharacterized protein FOMMEDRAFT_31543 [Fomitiporia mediterranea MF3/22]|uniref:uncharacterized protein n=1 Tax=Fomitiporia mediterranea (strain MF3/22) TaxID=694068 RepID=UPI00044072B0|nr:uncharacterized protein FOMMEDRAFT_31543 [Fomitiporia mediterranea MF3/22]EJC98986.1 hypothetical protein FOMMEDRAFT_31543 [Fomitiporia mediterranea MF3/22]